MFQKFVILILLFFSQDEYGSPAAPALSCRQVPKQQEKEECRQVTQILLNFNLNSISILQVPREECVKVPRQVPIQVPEQVKYNLYFHLINFC